MDFMVTHLNHMVAAKLITKRQFTFNCYKYCKNLKNREGLMLKACSRSHDHYKAVEC